MITFSEVADAADDLSVSEQRTLVELLQRRIAEKNRATLLEEIAEARTEFQNGKMSPRTPNEIMNEPC